MLISAREKSSGIRRPQTVSGLPYPAQQSLEAMCPLEREPRAPDPASAYGHGQSQAAIIVAGVVTRRTGILTS